jgi:ABC-2 type transport system ATP-binding protein
MSLRRRPRRRTVTALAAAVVLIACAVLIGLVVSRPGPVSVRTVVIPVIDGPRNEDHVLIDATFFTPPGAGKIPAILLAHGFGQTKAATAPEASQLAQAGFAVLTWSARGFGASTGQIGLDSPDYEVKDTEQLVSWLARQPRVLLDHPGDPRVGITGASYGGGIALLAAAYDHRIDAIVPQITWNNLATALFPDAAGGGPAGGVFARQWAGLLFTEGSAGFGATTPAGRAGSAGRAGQARAGQARAAQARAAQCGRFLPAVCASYQRVATLGRATPQAIALLTRSSPSSVASRIDVPTLLIQGQHDSLFGLGQASANYWAIRHNGAPVDMVWFAGGHDGGDQETARLTGLTAQWFDRWLKPAQLPLRGGRSGARLATGQPGFAVSRDLGYDPSSNEVVLGIATAAGYPGLGGTQHTLVRLAGPAQTIANPPGGAPPSLSVFPGLGSLGSAVSSGGSAAGGLSFDMPGQSASFESAPLPGPVQVTGAPTVRIRVSGAGAATLFAKVYDVDQAGNATLPDSLAAPLRVSAGPAGQLVPVQLPAIDYDFAAGHRLRLVLTTTDFAYASSPVPAAYQVGLAGGGLSLPADPGLQVAGDGVPWWTWAAPAAALVVAAAILLAGRRRTRDTLLAALADVPLEIVGLTKRYHDGQLAVDDVSFRVERGQILGLLGPNGAGKTSTLRILMGLLHQDAGTITIFGRRVHSGSPALSRLGAFVEGPGFLPHLSGRANLELYWRATGRPVTDSRLADVLEVASLGAAIDRKVRTYSRGMCQRLAIAQAMLGLPDLLVLDEPMNGLDPPQIRHMREVLVRYAADGRTVILSSHMLAEVELTCTHVVVMHQGRRLAAGAVGEIVGAGAPLVIGTGEAAHAVSVLRGLPGIERAEPHPDGVLVHPDGVPASAVVAALVRAGVPVEQVTRGRRLEDAFLALIGDGAGLPDGAPAASPLLSGGATVAGQQGSR